MKSLVYDIRLGFFCVWMVRYMEVNDYKPDNRLKKIYSEYPGYKELEENDQLLFDNIFPIIWVNEKISMSNKSLGAKYGYAESTMEKRLRKFENASLIIREVVRECVDGVWTSHRTIELDSRLYQLMLSGLKLKPKRIEAMTDSISEDKEEISHDQKHNDKENKKQKNKFIFRRH